MENNAQSRSIAIVGAGLTGLGFLTALLDLPDRARPGWQIDCYERRDSVGGIWHPQKGPPPEPPQEPETPFYDGLECITLCNGITFPNRPFPQSTPLYPDGLVVDKYIHDHVDRFKLKPYIRLGHTVIAMTLSPSTESKYPWTLEVQRPGHDIPETRRYSTVILATGITPTPDIISWSGQDEWLARNAERKILHSMWYRTDEFARGRCAVVIGAHPSGAHIARALSTVCRDLYHIFVPDRVTESEVFPPIKSSNYHPIHNRISSFAPDGIFFEDGTTLSTPNDTVIVQCTGYRRIFPILDKLVRHVPNGQFSWDDPADHFECNDRYIRPLYNHLIPTTPSIPPGSLALGCLFPIIWNLPTSYAQGLWFAHVMANKDTGREMMPERRTMRERVRSFEEEQQSKGVDVAKKGYLLFPLGKATDDYADSLITNIRAESSFPLPEYLRFPIDRPYTEPWRRRAFEVTTGLVRAWDAAKQEGLAKNFSEGARTEEEYAESVEKLVRWWDGKQGEIIVA